MKPQVAGWGGMDWFDLAQDRDMAGARECGNKPSGSIKCGEFIDWMRTCQLLKKDSAPWGSVLV